MTVAERACGTRKAGGVYACCPTSPYGRPFETFIQDPPARVPAAMRQALGLTDIGVKVLPATDAAGKTVYHVWNIVGQTSYPNVADWLEEARRWGVSVRCELNADDYAKLTPESTIIILHRRGWLVNAIEYFLARPPVERDAMLTTPWPCPKALPAHTDDRTPPEMCASLWWEDITAEDMNDQGRPRAVFRQLPSVTYVAQRRPPGVFPHHDLAWCATFPLVNLAVIRDPSAEHRHTTTLSRVALTHARISLEDE